MANFNLDELADTAGGRRRKPEVARIAQQKSREATVPITFNNQTDAVRTQMRMMALEQGDTAENKFAEALNDLFAKYGKPEIAVVKPRKGRAA
jgi:hypothetical protein